MRKAKILALTAASLAGAPVVALAVPTITFSYGVSVDGGTTYTPVVGNTISIVAGSTVELELLADVTNNAYTTTYVATPQPVNLGLASYALGYTDVTKAYATLSGHVTVPSPLNATSKTGTSDGNGGYTGASIAGGYLPGNEDPTNAAQAAALGYAGGTAAPVFTGLTLNALSAGTDTFNAILAAPAVTYVKQLTAGNTTTPPTYGSSNAGFTTTPQTNALLPSLALTVNVTGGGHNIVSLVNSASSDASGNYGTTLSDSTAVFTPSTPTDNQINVVGSIAAGYVAGTATLNTSSGKANVNTTFTGAPASGTEAYALQLSDTNAADLATIVMDINGVANANSAADGVVASLVSGSAYAGVFPNDQILLLANTSANVSSSNLGFDFTQEKNITGVTVLSVSAVPEPATAAGLVLGTAGLLLGRRKNRLV